MTAADHAGPHSAPVPQGAAPPRIKPLETNQECTSAAALLARIWGTSPESAPLSSDLIRSLVHAGGCAVAALRGDDVVGVAVAISGPPKSSSVYSLIAAVDRAQAALGIGRALKEAQRTWALERGARTMTWTFDPLIRRNAHFNLVRLGADVVEFCPSFYPVMHDAINRNDLSDRLTVRWDLTGARAESCDHLDAPVVLEPTASGAPRRLDAPADASALLAGIPADIEHLRVHDRWLAARWRLELREVLSTALSAGYRVAGLRASGHYVLRRPPR